ncbi:hypothetical protein K431DRAFT_45471 [Polychaeton citri CBS 116435]|uniref:Uncharacterized protein n=1 Tax=Polychaeton citri CBS 116435 TaxID=1314669 RepID=A0A9P4UNN2_9PEZI|nr:hypothetical protein K431DRAFT_45471 [Polychaeton citri CBS 116435]
MNIEKHDAKSHKGVLKISYSKTLLPCLAAFSLSLAIIWWWIFGWGILDNISAFLLVLSL